jgi:hypothetical protein
MAVDVVLYSRPGCCLCDDAAILLKQMHDEFDFCLRKVDIDGDVELGVRYNVLIPVLLFDGRHRLALRITADRLRRSLEKAGARRLTCL